MKDSKVLGAILFVLGGLLVVLGMWRLAAPVAFFEASGIVLPTDPAALNEARAAGGAVLAFGIVIALGTFVASLRFTSTLVAVVLFLGFGFARLVGFALDGNPGEMIIQGIVFELVFGSIALAALLKFRSRALVPEPRPA